jgi:hypothetical protein
MTIPQPSEPSGADQEEDEMTEGMLHTDANAVAGVLQEVFVGEMTSVERVCQSCRARSAAGAHRAYQGAGVVLRCPACGDVAARISTLPRQRVLELRGVWFVGV